MFDASLTRKNVFMPLICLGGLVEQMESLPFALCRTGQKKGTPSRRAFRE